MTGGLRYTEWPTISPFMAATPMAWVTPRHQDLAARLPSNPQVLCAYGPRATVHPERSRRAAALGKSRAGKRGPHYAVGAGRLQTTSVAASARHRDLKRRPAGA